MRLLARRASAFGLAALLATVAACGDDPTAGDPVRGEMRATLVSPNGAEGSAVLEVVSGALLDVAAPEPGVRVYWSQGGKVVVLRRAPGQIAFRLLAADVNQPPELRVVEVGAPDDALRDDLSGYTVAVTPGAGS